MTTSTAPEHVRPPFWRDVRVLRVAGQVAALAVVILLVRWLGSNLTTNMARQGIGTGFGFLGQPTRFTIPYFPQFQARSPVIDMVWVGVKNTLLAGAGGIALASVVGLVVGVSRLSQNWLVARLAALFVEFFRNIPPLVIILFFGAAVFTFGPLPILQQALQVRPPGSTNTMLLLSRDQWGVVGLSAGPDVNTYLVVVVAALMAAIGVWVWRTRRNLQTGVPHHRVLWALGVLVGLTVLAYLILDRPFSLSYPALSENLRRIEGGFAMNWGYMALTAALGLYTASHIGEIIRGSIQAVDRGQTEASSALALSSFQRYRFVILPQALRIAFPPIINQFLNLVKNTSLGIAVAYAEITALTQTSIGNGRPAVPSIVILMVVYLSFSLIISFVLNIVNRRMALVTR